MFLFAACLISVPVWAGPKLIEYGWDCPNTAYFREHISEMEKLPFDGVVISISPADDDKSGKGSISRWPFSSRRYELEEYQHAIDDLKATKCTRLTDNFIQLVTQPGNVDWFDPGWSSICHNAGCLARVAKEGGCKGLMLDPEQYSGYPTWGYSALLENLKSAHSFEEYQAKARERGREFIRAINARYPDLTILTLFGPSITYVQSRVTPLRDCEYSLLSAFYDGICEAATPGTILIDGYEFSYGYRIREAFVEGRKVMLEGAKSISLNPRAFEKHVRAGFGIWSDFNSGRFGWYPDDLRKNYFSPAGLRASVNYALNESDGYVWVYCERLKWWDGSAPKEFVEALRLAKSGPGPGDIPRTAPPRAAEQPGYSDAETFSKLGHDLVEVMDLPKVGWRFRTDAGRVGEKQGWQSVVCNDSAWRSICIGKFWEEQGEDYDGTAWYRLEFLAPKAKPGSPLYLAFGAADESATVWLNGKLVGVHDIGDYGWNVPFMLDVSRHIKQGARNVLAVRVFDISGGGGLWKSVKLMSKRAGG